MSDDETLGARAKGVRKECRMTQAQMAEFLGLSIGTWQKLERDEVVPTGETLLQFSKLGINPGWLLSSLGPRYTDPSKIETVSVRVDPTLMEALYKAVEGIYRDMGQKPPNHRIANEAATLFNVLVERVTNISDTAIVEAVIPVLAKELMEKVTRAALEPGTGKRSA